MKLNKDVDTTNPWKTKQSSLVYETAWVKVMKNDVISPRGKDCVYSYVDKADSVGAVVVNANNEIYLVGQYRYPMDEFTWEIIEGGIEEGESPLEAVKREIKEEAGLKASNHNLILEDFHIANGLTNERGNIFLVTDIIEEGAQSLDPTEKIVIKKVPFDEAVQMVYKGEIKDSYSIVGILLAKNMLFS